MKALLLGVVLIVISLTAYSATSLTRANTIEACYSEYKQKTESGHKAFALAFDTPYFICGFAWGASKAKYAINGALDYCEQGRRNPQAEVNGVRAVMTHCRIYQSEVIE